MQNLKFILHDRRFKLTGLYLLCGVLWILFSDHLLLLIFHNPDSLTTALAWNSTIFILVTALLLYLVLDYFHRTDIQRLTAFADSYSDAMFVLDRRGRFLSLNKAGVEHLGVNLDDIIGRDERALFPAAIAQRMITANHSVFKSGVSAVFQDEIKFPNGKTRTVLVTKNPLHDERGRIIGLLGIATDISERVIGSGSRNHNYWTPNTSPGWVAGNGFPRNRK